uniref:Tubulin delta chain n=1 Tax=Schmidtea mediterranea TaxID=79327 RepID=H6WA42_SCHMD|nr:TUBD1 [Schmidtea mediterranea]
MSIIILQVGQCGNQVGYSFFKTIHDDCYLQNNTKADNDYTNESIERFFYHCQSGKLESRGIQIDMEEKVISNQNMDNNKWCYAMNSKYIQKQGSGNNWANGYCNNGPKVIQKLEDLMRFQFERADSIDGVLITMSVAGGTGSGVGTLMSRFIKENYPLKTLVNHLVWPYKQGEVSVQAYNALLSVANILGQNEDGLMDSTLSADSVIIHENDLLHSVCQNRLALPKIGVDELNNLICHQLASVLQPVDQTKLPLSELVLTNIIHPDYRLLKLRNVPYTAENCRAFTTDTWHQLMKQINQMILTDSVAEEGLDWNVKVNNKLCANLTNHIVLRGHGCDSIARESLALNNPRMYSNYLGNHTLNIWSHCRKFNGYEKSITALTNGRDSVCALDNATAKAWNMFNTDAFLYQYEKYGLSRSHFLDCFANTEQIIHNYKIL